MFSLTKNHNLTRYKSDKFSRNVAREVIDFHRKMPGYEPTPLVSLKGLAHHLGLKNVFVKDESKRFGLNAFKVLGGSYALAKALANHIGIDFSDFDFNTVLSVLEEPLTFITATAGNHGTGIAWAARELKQSAIILMPKGAPRTSIDRLKSLGADCIVTDVNYDETVRLAEKMAHTHNYMLVQDTAWDGYEDIPTWVSQGYMTMAEEALKQIQDSGSANPTHVMLQAGVGSMAGGVLGYLTDVIGLQALTSIITEPVAADCLKRSAENSSDELVCVDGDLASIMKGLACGEVNPITWNVIKNCATFFASVSEDVSATGMRILANPLPGDKAIIGGPSGAVNVGLIYAVMKSLESSDYKKLLNLNADSSILIFNTEGDTDPNLYRKIVWEGCYGSKL